MSHHSSPLQYPCPRCQTSRADIESSCDNCGWHPDEIATARATEMTATHQPNTNPNDATSTRKILGLLAIIVGLLLIGGAACFLILMYIFVASEVNLVFWIAAVIQLLIGIGAAGFGLKWLRSDH